MISVIAAAIIICLVSYFYFFYFNNPGLAGLKSWITSAESSGALESTQPEGSSGQKEAKPDLSIVEVSIARVEIKAADSGSEGAKNTIGIENTKVTGNTGSTENVNSANTTITTTGETTATTGETTATTGETTATTSETTATTGETAATTGETTATTRETADTSSKKRDEIYIGDTVKFDVLVKNIGALPAKNIKIIDLPSDKLENINMAEGSGGSYDPFSRKIVLDIAKIGSGETIKVAFTGIISNDLNDGDIIENKVTALYADAVIAEKSTESSVTGLPDYTATLVKVEDVNGSKIWARDILKYSVIVKNSGKKVGGSIVLNCPVPTSTGYVDGTASGSGLIISPNKSLIQFNIGKIEPGSQKEFSFKVFVADYLTFSTDIKSGFFITDGREKISLENPSVTTEASVFQTVVCMGDSQVVLSDYTTQLGTLLNNQYSHAVLMLFLQV